MKFRLNQAAAVDAPIVFGFAFGASLAACHCAAVFGVISHAQGRPDSTCSGHSCTACMADHVTGW